MTFNANHFAGLVHSIDLNAPLGSCFFATNKIVLTALHIFGDLPLDKNAKYVITLIFGRTSENHTRIEIGFTGEQILFKEDLDLAIITLSREVKQAIVIPIIDQGIGSDIDILGIGYPPDHLQRAQNPDFYNINATTIKSSSCQVSNTNVFVQLPFIKGMSGGPVICPQKDYQLVGMIVGNQSVGLDYTIYEEKEDHQTGYCKEYIRLGKYLKISMIEAVLKEMGLLNQMRRHIRKPLYIRLFRKLKISANKLLKTDHNRR